MNTQSASLKRCRAWTGLAFAALCLSLTATPLLYAADIIPDATRGLAIAMKTCAGCHLIGDGSARTASAGVPSFGAIANRKGQSAERIISALVLPHPPMPDTHLTRVEIMDIVAYLDTLRDRRNGKPSLLRNTKPRKLPPKGRTPS